MIDPDASRNSEQAARREIEKLKTERDAWERVALHHTCDATQARRDERERLYELLGPVLRYAQGMVTADGPDCKCELCEAWADVQRRAPAGDAGQ